MKHCISNTVHSKKMNFKEKQLLTKVFVESNTRIQVSSCERKMYSQNMRYIIDRYILYFHIQKVYLILERNCI